MKSNGKLCPLGKLVVKALTDQDKTKTQLAAEIGTSPQYLSYILYGVRSGEKYLPAIIAKMERGELDIIYILEEPLYNNSWCKVLERQEEVVVVASAELGRELGPGPHHLAELLDRPFYLTERDANYRRLLDRRLATLDRAITPALESSYASFLLRVLEETEGLSFLPRFLVEEPVRQGKLTVVEVCDLQAVMYEQIFYHREKWATREMEAFIRFCAPEAAAWVGAAAPDAANEGGAE